MQIPNALDPTHMTAAERLDEVTEILAAGLLRWRSRRAARNRSNNNSLRDFPLDFSPGKNVCGREPANNREGR